MGQDLDLGTLTKVTCFQVTGCNIIIYWLRIAIILFKILQYKRVSVKITRRNIDYLRYADDTTIIKSDESERKEWKSWLKIQHSENKDHSIWSHPLMANKRGESGNSDRFYFLGLKNHCGWWLQPWNPKTLAPWKESYDKPRQCIKRHLLFGRKVMTNLDNILKSRDITLSTKAMVFQWSCMDVRVGP